MPKKHAFKTPSDSQHILKGTKHLRNLHDSTFIRWAKITWKMSLLVICEIMGHSVNTLTANDKYSLLNSENLQQPIQMQLSKERISFSEFFFPFLKFIYFFEHFEKKTMTLITYVFQKIRTAKDAVRQMSKKPRFRTLSDSQHVKWSQTLVISVRQHFYHICSSLWAKLIWKVSFLVICDILGHFVKILTAGDKYYHSENFLQPIQMQLSRKQKVISPFFPPFVKSISIFEH